MPDHPIRASRHAGCRRGFAIVTAVGLLAAAWPALSQTEVQVRVEPVVRAPIVERLPLSGSVLSPRSSSIALQESGLVESIAVDAGDLVAQDDVLLELDREIARLELERLLAAQQEARFGYEDAARLATEARRLVEDRNISRTEYNTRLANEAAQQARLLQLGVQVQTQRVRVGNHVLRAPFDGVIGFKQTEVGEWLGAGNPAFQLVQLDPLRLQAPVPERYFRDVRAGTPVTITVDALPGQRFEAAVDRIVAVSDTNTRSFVARVDLPNEDLALAPGMSANLEFELGGARSLPVLQVPADAVVRRPGGGAVVFVVRDGMAEALEVRTGRRNREWVEVTSDSLREGEPVVTLGNESLRSGQAVTVVGD